MLTPAPPSPWQERTRSGGGRERAQSPGSPFGPHAPFSQLTLLADGSIGPWAHAPTRARALTAPPAPPLQSRWLRLVPSVARVREALGVETQG